MDLIDLAINSGKIFILFMIIVQVVPIMNWAERRGAALFQDRPGPNRVGPFGLLQPIADFAKFLWKEDPIPLNVNRFLFSIAPFIGMIPASLVIAAIPFADQMVIGGRTYLIQIADINVGILYVLSIGSLGIYGILFGGWASNNKYSLMGAMRSSSQLISYEIPIGLAAAVAVMFYGSFSLRDMVMAQEGTMLGVLPRWGIFYQPLGFLIFFISAFAETNRMPFDLPESEAELVGGFHTEYGSMRFAVFMMAEYMNLATMCCMLTTLYFGGWHVPWVTDAQLLAWLGNINLVMLVQIACFLFKMSVFLFIFVWVRWTVPRFRFDQLMRVSWVNLIPLGIINLVVTAILLYLKEAP